MGEERIGKGVIFCMFLKRYTIASADMPTSTNVCTVHCNPFFFFIHNFFINFHNVVIYPLTEFVGGILSGTVLARTVYPLFF